jgi:hyperosmotically inducible protein
MGDFLPAYRVCTTAGEQISKALRRHAEREAKHIGVKVRDGTVTLTGTVDSMAERSVQ